MKMNKRGEMDPGLKVILSFIFFIILVVGFVYLVGFAKSQLNLTTFDFSAYLADSAKIGDLTGKQGLNVLSYIIGEVPQAIVDATSNYGSVTVIVLVFFMLLLMFGDILSSFGTFGNKYIAWVIATMLTIVAANFKLVMIYAAVGFGLVSTLGIFAAVLSIFVPFVISIMVHLLFLGNVKRWAKDKQARLKQGENIDAFDRGFMGTTKVGKTLEKGAGI
tara:strand:- start:53 stop:709 length:657 start_codon:yes stop_codon:yes gene_type:complete